MKWLVLLAAFGCTDLDSALLGDSDAQKRLITDCCACLASHSAPDFTQEYIDFYGVDAAPRGAAHEQRCANFSRQCLCDDDDRKETCVRRLFDERSTIATIGYCSDAEVPTPCAFDCQDAFAPGSNEEARCLSRCQPQNRPGDCAAACRDVLRFNSR